MAGGKLRAGDVENKGPAVLPLLQLLQIPLADKAHIANGKDLARHPLDGNADVACYSLGKERQGIAASIAVRPKLLAVKRASPPAATSTAANRKRISLAIA